MTVMGSIRISHSATQMCEVGCSLPPLTAFMGLLRVRRSINTEYTQRLRTPVLLIAMLFVKKITVSTCYILNFYQHWVLHEILWWKEHLYIYPNIARSEEFHISLWTVQQLQCLPSSPTAPQHSQGIIPNHWRTHGSGLEGSTPPKFRSFEKAGPNSHFCGIYICNNLIRIRVLLIYKLSETPN
jgi:hypothetical protein